MLSQQCDKNPVLRTYCIISSLFKLRQHSPEVLVDYKKRFVAAAEVIEHIAGTFGGALVNLAEWILEKDYGTKGTAATDEQASLAETKAFDKLTSVPFIQSSYRARFEEVPADV